MQTSETFKRNGSGVETSTPQGSSEDVPSGTGRSVSQVNTVKALFIFAAGVSFLFSVYLWFLVDKSQGVFVGLWVPSILSLGGLMLAGKEQAR